MALDNFIKFSRIWSLRLSSDLTENAKHTDSLEAFCGLIWSNNREVIKYREIETIVTSIQWEKWEIFVTIQWVHIAIK
jgi:hypothetical protein